MQPRPSTLDPEQQAAVTHPPGAVRIVAGAGTGKTTTITHRIAHQHRTRVIPASQVLAVTHSRKAASELRDRLAVLGAGACIARTFHSAALRQLAYFWSATGLPGTGPVILRDRRTLIRNAIAAAQGCHPSLVASETVLTIDSEISWAHATITSPADYAAAARHRNIDVDTSLAAAAYTGYEAAKKARGELDLDDVLLYAAQLVERHPAVRDEVMRTYTSFVVDEYQDTDAVQQKLLMAWLGGRDNVTIVGDPAQAIYGFKGADDRLLLNAERTWPGITSVALTHNYRSTPEVVAAANRVSEHIRGSVTLRAAGHQAGAASPRVVEYPDEAAEAAGIASRVRDLIHDGTPAGEVAVLHRFNSQAPALRAALTSAGVPVSVRTEEEFFTRPEIASAMRLLGSNATDVPDDDPVAACLEALDVGKFDENNPPEGVGAARTRWENQAALLDQVRTIVESGASTLAQVWSELVRRATSEHVPSSRNGVQVLTAHAAKGLEWDAVFVARGTRGSFPSSLATTPAELAEEKRLFYVAATRARHTLEVSWSRTWGTRKAASTPSPYLGFVEQGAVSGSTSAGPRRRVSGRTSGSATARTYGWSGACDGFVPGVRVSHDRHGLGRVVRAAPGAMVVDFGKGHVTVKAGEPVELL